MGKVLLSDISPVSLEITTLKGNFGHVSDLFFKNLLETGCDPKSNNQNYQPKSFHRTPKTKTTHFHKIIVIACDPKPRTQNIKT